MTAIVGIRCADGVVIGADGSSTFNQGSNYTIEQTLGEKIDIIDGKIMCATTGFVGHSQRFREVVKGLWNRKEFKFTDQPPMEIATAISRDGIAELQKTSGAQLGLGFGALVAYPSKNRQPTLCEFPVPLQGTTPGVPLQPELKVLDGLWFASLGSGQSITDPFLAFLRSTFWADGPPDIDGGIFTALWTLKHVCDVNPGGIKEPIAIAVLEHGRKNQLQATRLDKQELALHHKDVGRAIGRLGEYVPRQRYSS